MDYEIYFRNAQQAARSLAGLNDSRVQSVLRDVADTVEKRQQEILEANRQDLTRMSATDPKYDRLQLTEERIAGIASDIRNVAALPNPLGTEISTTTRPNGLEITKIRVPLGVVGIIYEARPNVTLDVFSLCFKTGNVAILKGGSDAEASNLAIVAVVRDVLAAHQINPDVVTLLPAERAATDALLNATGFVDVLIPRGSQQLIEHVRRQSRIPVIETGAGIVHTFFDESGDLEKGKAIITNAKTRRVSVCNALDCLLIHRSRLSDLPALSADLANKQVEIFADEESFQALNDSYPRELLHKAEPEHFGTEFLSLKMAIKTVGNLAEALDHIAEYSSRHSEAIISENPENIDQFLVRVDAAAVYANTSTAFTDGAQFGLGAEIGISTQKLHARGPMGLEELTSYKWIVKGNGQTRP